MNCPKYNQEMDLINGIELYQCCRVYWSAEALEEIKRVGYQEFCKPVPKELKKKGK